MKSIIVYKQLMADFDSPKYAAKLEDEPYWDAGRSPAEAIGNLILSHPDQFDIKVANLSRRLHNEI